jgi:hypothetical protein
MGFTSFFFITHLISQLLDVSVGMSGKITFLLLFGIFIVRFALHFPSKSLEKIGLIQIFLIFYAVYIIAQRFDRPLGTLNFDFLTAVQDGKFLVNHGVFESAVAYGTLPATWSAGIGSRYGISYLLSFLFDNFPSSNYLEIAQTTSLVCFSIGIITLARLLKSLLSVKISIAITYSSIASLSQLVLMQNHMQMYGQITALPVIYYLLFQILEKEKKKKDIFYILGTSITVFILYPPIGTPLIAFFIFLLLQNLIIRRQIAIKKSIWTAVTAIITLVLLYGPSLRWIIDTYSLVFSLSQKPPSAVNIQSSYFTQFSSVIGPSQFFGVVPYPYLGSWSLLFVCLQIVLSSSLIFALFYVMNIYIINAKAKQVMITFVFSFGLFAAYAFYRNYPYVVLKIATWLAPLIWSLLLVIIGTHFQGTQHRARGVKFSVTTFRFVSVSVVVGLFLNITYSFNYMGSLKRNTSFPQAITFAEGNNIRDLYLSNKVSDKKYTGIVTPSLEESMLVASNIPLANSDKLRSLGLQSMAYQTTSTENCNNTATLSGLNSITRFMFNPKIVDITPKFKTSFLGAVLEENTWRIIPTSSLESALIVTDGYFPPTFNTQIDSQPIPESKLLRWSSGIGCMAFYSNKKLQGLEFSIPILIGPDAPSNLRWESSGQEVKFSISPDKNWIGKLVIRQNIESGWNMIRIGVANIETAKNVSRLYNVRPDPRKLVFAAGEIDF